jgi:HK97 family phage major capsid protein
MKYLQDLKDERGRVLTAIDEILRTAKDDGNRSLRPDELSRHDELVDKFDRLSEKIDLANERGTRWNGSGGRSRNPDEPLILRSDESLVEALQDRWTSKPEDLSLTRMAAAMLTGDWRDAPAEEELIRSQMIAPASSGGFLVPEELSAQVIDLARKKARVFEAGAQMFQMTEGTVHMGRIAGDPTASWKKEGAPGTFSSGSYERLTFVAKTLVAMVDASVELIQDSRIILGTLEDQLSASLALELDRVALRGSGVDPEPLGVRNADNVTITSLGAAPTNYDFLSQAIQDIQTQNGDPSAILYSARTSGKLDRLKDTTNQPLQPPPSVAGIRRLVTNQIPDNLGAGSDSEVYIGDWTQLLVGMRTDMRIDATEVGAKSDGSAFTDLKVYVRAYLRADIAVAQPKHFVVETGVQ